MSKTNLCCGDNWGENMEDGSEPFWKRKSLEELTEAEWESVCDGCGLCCLLKLEDADSGARAITRVACKLLDLRRCRCKDYARRHDLVPDCVSLSARKVAEIDWLPDTCGYRLIAEGKDLAWWHPLVSGDRNSVHRAGISVRRWAVSETEIPAYAVRKFIMRSPGRRFGNLSPIRRR